MGEHDEVETSAKAQDVRSTLLRRSEGMTEALEEELFQQNRLVFSNRKEEVAPTQFIDSVEAQTVFRGLNHSRGRLAPIQEAAKVISADSKRARGQYEALLRRRRAE